LYSPQEVFVNPTDPKYDLDTEQRQRQQREVQTAPGSTEPAVFPDVKRDETASMLASTAESVQVESAAQSFSELSYVCLLIPRFSDHHLIGDITEDLVEWMKQICISYGWRLDAISVRPGYIQWVMIVPLNANPAQFIRLIRQHTSQKIFEDFPRFMRQNMSGQFWAPGNFVVAGTQLQTPETINNFILQTRRHQGIV
jgi:REP element-mobilizing transposase RayT